MTRNLNKDSKSNVFHGDEYFMMRLFKTKQQMQKQYYQ